MKKKNVFFLKNIFPWNFVKNIYRQGSHRNSFRCLKIALIFIDISNKMVWCLYSRYFSILRALNELTTSFNLSRPLWINQALLTIVIEHQIHIHKILEDNIFTLGKHDSGDHHNKHLDNGGQLEVIGNTAEVKEYVERQTPEETDRLTEMNGQRRFSRSVYWIC